MQRAPAFQFYPDKWQSHTRRLSDSAYRIFHDLMCWMWQSSPDQCSIEASPEAVACAVAAPLDKATAALAEIQIRHAPLLKEEGARLVMNGLRKERDKQQKNREVAQNNARSRWEHAGAMRAHCGRNAGASIPQCIPTPIPIPIPTPIPTPSKKGILSERAPTIDEFETLWNAYPSKTGSKEKSKKAWLKWRKLGDTVEIALAGIERYKASVAAQRANGFDDLKYQNGQTFFNGRGCSSEWKVEAAKTKYVSTL